MSKLHELGVAEAARQIREGRITSVELAQALLERIESVRSGALKAWVTVDREDVLTEARRRDEERNAGDIQGPLHGVPVGLKDIFYTEGMKTTACSPIYADFVPDHDATCVAMLKEAGAIVLGKAVTTEFASGDPSPTRNPWNPGPYAGRLQQRVGGGCVGGDVRGGAGVADRRLDRASGGIQRYSWTEADLRAHKLLRSRAAQLVSGYCGHPHPQRGGCGRHAASYGGI